MLHRLYAHPLSLLLSSQCKMMASLLFILLFTLTQFLTVPLSVIVLLNFTPSIAHCLFLILHPSLFLVCLPPTLSLSTSFCLSFHLSEMLPPCSAASLSLPPISVSLYLPVPWERWALWRQMAACFSSQWRPWRRNGPWWARATPHWPRSQSLSLCSVRCSPPRPMPQCLSECC